MDQVAVRELRNEVAAVLRRAAAGERIVVTSDGRPVAQLGPLDPAGPATLADLVAAGLVDPPAVRERPEPPEPVRLPPASAPERVLDRLRGQG